MGYSLKEKTKRKRRTHCRRGEPYRLYKKRVQAGRKEEELQRFNRERLEALRRDEFLRAARESKRETRWGRFVYWLRKLLGFVKE